MQILLFYQNQEIKRESKIQLGMSEEIDFIMPTFSRIIKPEKSLKSIITKDTPKTSGITKSSFQIQKSFKPEEKSQIHEQMRPEIQKMKKLLKAEREKEKKIKQMIAQGKLDRKQVIEERNIKIKEAQIQKNKDKLRIDTGGQLRDDKGNLVYAKNQTMDLQINKRQAHENQFKQMGKKQKMKVHQKIGRDIKDHNLVVSTTKKRFRKTMFGLQFIDEPNYQDYTQRQKQEVLDLNQALKIEPDARRYRKRQKTTLQFNRDVPDIQWWDAQILKIQQLKPYLQNSVKIEENEINIEQFLDIQKLYNPVVFQRVGSQTKKQPKVHTKVYLTKDERKKLRRKQRREKLIQKNDMIRLGLVEPDKPRLTISNMAMVKKNQFIIDPSRIQQQARKQMEERQNKHIQVNSERRLTKAQRKEKIIKKLKKDSAKESRRIIFKLKKLQNPSQSFKINVNARQLVLGGFILKPSQFHRMPTLIAAEGGQKAIRFFKNLMMNRIKWDQDGNQCRIIWQGQIDGSKLGKWRTIEAGDQLTSMKALKERNMDNFSQFIT